MSMSPKPGSPAWLASVVEPIIEPERPIIDPHHHLWQREGNDYLLADLHGDTGSGHNIVKTVFVECHANYYTQGPEHLRPVGEVAFVVEQALNSNTIDGQASIAGIVGHADLTQSETLTETLAALEEAGQGRFRGIRDAGASPQFPEALFIKGRAAPGRYLLDDFRAGIRQLGKLGYTYDTWHYHYQNREFLSLAHAAPDTLMVLDHFGTPLGVGPYKSQWETIVRQWREDIQEIARCPNVIAKLGGLAMPDNGFGWHDREMPPTSEEFVAAQREFYLHTIDCFGVARCMFESNFPVDKFSLSYPILYNGLKKIVMDFSETDKHQLFYGTAERVYRLAED